MDKSVPKEYYFLIVDRYDCLLFSHEFSSVQKHDPDASHLKQLIAHASLDVVDEMATQQSNMLLKQIDKFNEWTVSAFVLPSGVRFLMLHTCRNDEGIRNFFTEMYETFIKLSMNPFHRCREPIKCTNFEKKVQLYGRKYLIS